MPGNRAIFDRALEDSRTAIQHGAWPEALQAAQRATQEFPDDIDARCAVAIAVYHDQDYAQAVELLEDVRRRRGSDPVILSYLARAYEGGQAWGKAVAILSELAEQSLREHRPGDAQEAYEEAVRLAPADETMRLRLAELYVEQGQPRQAAEQCVAIAQARFAAGDRAGSREALDEATGLDPANQAAARLQREMEPAPETQPSSPAPGMPMSAHHTGQRGDPRAQIDHLVTRAVQERANGHGTAALNFYQEALALGADRPDIHYGYAVLLQEQGRHDQAVEALRCASRSEEYAVSAHYALGESLRALGKTREAAEAFEATVRLVDLGTVGRGEADDLVAMYQSAAECYVELEELSRAASLYGTLAALFQNKRWGRELADQFKARAVALTERSMVAKLRRMGTGTLSVGQHTPRDLEADPQSATTQTWGMVPSLTDFLRPDALHAANGAPPPDADPFASLNAADPFSALDFPEVNETIFAPLTSLPVGDASELTTRYVNATARFTEQGLFLAGIDACQEVIRTDPEYLQIHLRLGEIYERQGRIEQAQVKYRTLIDIYAARDEPLAAIDAHYRLIELSPDTVNTRSQLAELLRKAGREDEAIAQSLIVANTQFKIGQTNRALEEFRRLLSWAPAAASIHKEYGQALLKLERWDGALEEFRRAVLYGPDDPVALAQVNLTLAVLGANQRAMWESLGSLLVKLKEDARHSMAVQSEYRMALMLIDEPILHYILGIIQQAGDHHGTAILSFQQALSLQEGSSSLSLAPILVHQALAESFLAQGQAREAIEELEVALKHIGESAPGEATWPSFARPLAENELQRRLATALVTVDNPDGAAKALRRCLAIDPTDVPAYTQLAAVYFLQGKLPLALEQLDRVATAYEDRQQLDPAIETLEQAAKLAPNTIPVRSRLAHLLLRRGTLERGLRELKEVAQLQKNAGRTRDAVISMQHAAEAYWMLGKYPEAFGLYESVVALVPDDLDVRQQLASLYVLAGQHAEAIIELRRIAQACLDAGNQTDTIAALQQIVGLQSDDVDALAQLCDLLVENDDDEALHFLGRLERLRPAEDIVEKLARKAAQRLAVSN